ncbi:GNAT family N-acetyltransferase [Anaerotignum propionicum]|uniref:GNAT acetyltransferase n=1 Tax=Anaerotignum propionicum DSM 1682 TaxID=991789 RepID=A0A0X1U8K5_ANAPI|nr:GNAT family N-acetyltransferase [Anaerotignum propionicum]AMJ41254.1 GNAT acetyltransferase [Anaerotignum propionicum DSM 1682]SHF05969.1 GNAT acetyltransferase [[Clostridium] propionicum DSM 1682] [Anaerotignum propionicum DSM 1682]
MSVEKAATLFDGWNEAMIWSCLQGHMGNMITDNSAKPTSALIDVGDICFFAGKPDSDLFQSIVGFKLLVPKDKDWETQIESYYGKRARKFLRYAIKKEPNVFDRGKLIEYIKALDHCYEVKLFNEEIFQMARSEAWSVDLCSQFKDYTDYQKRAIGVAILHKGKLVSGASPYAVYNGGIEIEIDTKPEYRQKGLATVCGAKLILECLERKLYPSWDAHDMRSVSLAEKLGYHLDHSYVTYELSD